MSFERIKAKRRRSERQQRKNRRGKKKKKEENHDFADEIITIVNRLDDSIIQQWKQLGDMSLSEARRKYIQHANELSNRIQRN